ncbi:MAG: family 1 glycosylhydrolase [Candidatus Omnitrophota bacterium]|nr:family 1 glycosylhydrolase [Candidatus Omnitrophota bacterium]
MNNPFGVLEFLHWSHEWNNYKYSIKEDLERAVALVKEIGAGRVRMDFLWSDIEPLPGIFEFEKYDNIVELLNKNNIGILGILNYNVQWASKSGKWNCPPNDKLFISYCQNVVERYKDKIKYWEIWNEPDSSIYWEPQDGLVSYCALLKKVYPAIKEIDPEIKVLNGGLSGGYRSVNRLYDCGVKDYFDILNMHIFDTPLNPDAVKAVTSYPKLAHQVMVRNSDKDKKIWITEIGCPGIPGNIETKNWWFGENPDELKQAKWLKQVYTELLRDKNIEMVFWAFFRDCKGHWLDGTDYFGLVRWDFSQKPAYFAFKESRNRGRSSKHQNIDK